MVRTADHSVWKSLPSLATTPLWLILWSVWTPFRAVEQPPLPPRLPSLEAPPADSSATRRATKSAKK
eukprot:845014-Amphidinium_carterae.1